jgi:uncharacterized protein YgfB (UPF0149 family)
MNQETMPDYQALNQVLSQTMQKLHPSQVHGMISGILSGNVGEKLNWEELVAGGEDRSKTHDILQALFLASQKQLEEFLFEFELMLPPDSESLSERAEALTLWCQGYLTGLKLSDVKLAGRAPGDVTEAINDMIEIAKMNYEDVVASEEDEAAYTDLVEYVRMAAILIYQDMHEQNSSKPVKCNHLH